MKQSVLGQTTLPPSGEQDPVLAMRGILERSPLKKRKEKKKKKKLEQRNSRKEAVESSLETGDKEVL
jgi:hypothetical protein